MGESLEEFLGAINPKNQISIHGSLSCQECDEVVSEGYLDEDNMIITYLCQNNHTSSVRI